GQDPDRPLPKNAWPEFIETLYGAWRVPYHQERLTLEDIPAKERPVFEMFNRLSFMYGEPYQEGNLAPEIHHRLQELAISPLKDGGKLEKVPAGSAIRVGETAMGEVAYDFDGVLNEKLWVFRTDNDFKQGQLLSADGRLIGKVEKVGRKDDMNGPLLPMLFGPMSLDLFRHGAENLRAGVATTLKDAVNDSGNGDHDREPEPILAGTDDAAVYERLERLDGLTLIGGGLNRLWHRDCIDRMADWLDRSAPLRETCRKTMLLNYGHQDLFWGRNAARDVFPKIVDGLGSPSPDAGPKDKEPEEDDPRRQQVPVS
ncbi:MAG: hypothetical protein ACR2QJ_14905, partial [Geminicoccaceae bacterium]